VHLRRASPGARACGVLAALWLVCSASALADVRLSREIAAQPLAAALAEFAHQTGLQLVYVSDVLKDHKSRGARAGASAADALTALLEGTGLTFEFLNERAVRILAEPPRMNKSGDGPQPAAHRQERGGALDEVNVWGEQNERLRAFESVQNAASAVTLLSPELLEAQKSEQLLDYAASVPGMSVLTPGAPGQPQITFRGIYPLTGARAVASYIDDTAIGPTGPYANAQGLDPDLMPYDLERLELWRGPQGTSIGAESEIGLVRYVLVQPDVAAFHANVAADAFSVHGADESGESIFGAANLPVVSGQLAVRVSGYDSYTPGYVDNIYSGAKGINVLRRYGGRLAALWQPSETFSVTVNALQKTDAAQSWSQVTFNRLAVVPNSGDAYFVRQTGSWGDLVDDTALLSPGRNRLDLFSLSLRWSSGALQVHSATAWSRIDNFSSSDQTQAYGSYYPAWSNGKVAAGLALAAQSVGISKFSEELHVGSSTARLVEWQWGAFYTSESTATNHFSIQALDSAYQAIEFFSPSISFTNMPTTFAEEAMFGNFTWHLTGQLDLRAGIRSAHDEQSLNFAGGGWNSPPDSFFSRSAEEDTSWMTSTNYRLDPSTAIYARVASGFQPAFPNDPGAPATLRGERPVNYELGLKAESLRSRLLTDLVGFYVDWKDIQVGAVTPDGVFYYANGAHGFSRGFELTGSYVPIPDLQLGYTAAYTECALDGVIPAANYYLTGYQIPDVPKWTLSATTAYSWPIQGLWRAQLGTALRWLDQQWNAPGAVQSQSAYNYPAVVIPSYWVLDMNAQASKGPLTLRVFVRNLTDARAFVNRFAILDPSNTPVLMVNKLLQPRTIGIGFGYSF
jgi:iron complex outermembrane receptor protein